jgi:hypothetical protein
MPLYDNEHVELSEMMCEMSERRWADIGLFAHLGHFCGDVGLRGWFVLVPNGAFLGCECVDGWTGVSHRTLGKKMMSELMLRKVDVLENAST